jgi:hypothetical protein
MAARQVVALCEIAEGCSAGLKAIAPSYVFEHSVESKFVGFLLNLRNCTVLVLPDWSSWFWTSPHTVEDCDIKCQ